MAKKGSVDFHDEMDSDRLETLFQDQLLPNLPTGAIIVMDNASYHSRRLEPLPTSKWRKNEIMTWLISRNITVHEDSLKRELLAQVDEVKGRYFFNAVDEMAKKQGFTVQTSTISLRTKPH